MSNKHVEQACLMSNKHVYQTEIQQMMFVFGEVQDPLPETSQLLEDIVKSQVMRIGADAALQAQNRGTRHIHPEDIIFLIRHDRETVNRIKMYLSWKEARKAERDDGGDGDELEGILIDEEADEDGGGPEKKSKSNKRTMKLPWELLNGYANLFEENDDDEQDEEYRDFLQGQAHRLQQADEYTRHMSKEEYIHYTDCRGASFSYKKQARFVSWCNMSSFAGSKLGSDAAEVLGFMAYNFVQHITETALKVKKEWQDKDVKEHSKKKNPLYSREEYLFETKETAKTPLRPAHITEAMRIISGQRSTIAAALDTFQSRRRI